MAQAANESDFRMALASQAPEIELTASFSVSTQLTIGYPVTVFSQGAENYTISKTNRFAGYLFRIGSGGVLSLRNLILDGSDAGRYIDNDTNRSLVFIAGGTVHLESGAVLQNNSSYQEGGGVYLSGSPDYINTFSMSGDARIVGCESRSSGGGIMVALRNARDNAALLDQASVQGNTARDGGGIYYRSYLNGVGGTFTIGDQVRVAQNVATSTGGGIAASGFREGSSAPIGLSIEGNAVISENQAVSGGGVYFYGVNTGDRLILTESAALRQNTATGNGGGLFATFPRAIQADVALTGGMVEKNTAGTGAGVYLLTSSGGALLLSQTRIAGNQATNGASGSGGGLWMQNNSSADSFSLTVRDSVIEENSASANGGGAIINGGNAPATLTVTGSTISGNSAQTNGGGMQVGSAVGVQATVSDSKFDGNSAQNSGGGLYFVNTTAAASGQLHLTNVQVTGNTAGLEGGGMRIGSDRGFLTATMTDCIVQDNTAVRSSGGGIWSGGTNMALTLGGASDIRENRSTAGNGGGVYFNSGSGTLILQEKAKIQYNQAEDPSSATGNNGGGISIISGQTTIQDDAEIAHNSAAKHGGGISASENVRIYMTGGSIHDNSSGQAGGGVYNHAGSAFTLTGGSVYSNSAAVGGGIYNDSLLTVTQNGQLGEPTLNTASQYAPGIYNSGTLHTQGDRHISNGLYLESRDAAVQLDGPLSPGAVIQLDRSGYVEPNPSQAPIVVGESTPDYPVLSQIDADAFQKPSSGFEDWEIIQSGDRTQALLVPVSKALHTVSYHGNDAQGPPARGVPQPQQVEDGQSVRLSDTAPTRDGYRFVGWSATRTGAGQRYFPGDTVDAVTKDVDLYALWQPLFPGPPKPPMVLCCCRLSASALPKTFKRRPSK